MSASQLTLFADPDPLVVPPLPARAGYLGKSDIRLLESDGWSFSDRGLKIGGGYLVWSQRGEVLKLRCLADPAQFPEMWPENL